MVKVVVRFVIPFTTQFSPFFPDLHGKRHHSSRFRDQFGPFPLSEIRIQSGRIYPRFLRKIFTCGFQRMQARSFLAALQMNSLDVQLHHMHVKRKEFFFSNVNTLMKNVYKIQLFNLNLSLYNIYCNYFTRKIYKLRK